MRKLLVLVVLIGAFVVGSAALAASKTIKMGDNYYVRSTGVPTVTVAKGTRVTWRNRGKAPHTVAVSKGPAKFHSRTIDPGKSYSRTVRTKGTYTIFCTIHGAQDQRMKLVVR